MTEGRGVEGEEEESLWEGGDREVEGRRGGERAQGQRG
jgi:hypothetical protein